MTCFAKISSRSLHSSVSLITRNEELWILCFCRTSMNAVDNWSHKPKLLSSPTSWKTSQRFLRHPEWSFPIAEGNKLEFPTDDWFSRSPTFPNRKNFPNNNCRLIMSSGNRRNLVETRECFEQDVDYRISICSATESVSAELMSVSCQKCVEKLVWSSLESQPDAVMLRDTSNFQLWLTHILDLSHFLNNLQRASQSWDKQWP